MRVCVGMDYRFDRTPDGAVWTRMAFDYEFFWSHYLSAFDEVRVIARMHDVPATPPGAKRADGPKVTFAPIPFYHGPVQYALRRARIGRVIRENVRPGDAVIARIPSQVCNQMLGMLEKGRPFGVQVVGDPHDSFAPGATRHPLRWFFRWWFESRQRKQCAEASAAAFVTSAALQSRYPCACHSTHFSDVKLPAALYVDSPRAPGHNSKRVRLITVGTLESLYKAQDTLIEAVGRCAGEGLDLELVVAGEGIYRPALEALAAKLGVGGRVHFRGLVPAGDAVIAELDAADVFVLASRQEGLPRAMIEAMARGLPCIGSTVGGIPELLPVQDLVPPGDAEALARKIREVAGDPARRARMSAANLVAARAYSEDVMRERRIDFYRKVREQMEDWVRRSR